MAEVPEVGAPSEADRADLERARAVHAAMASVDLGQSCVVAGGQVLGVEALPGTDFLLASLARRSGAGVAPAPPVPAPPTPSAPVGRTVPARSPQAGRPVPSPVRPAPEAPARSGVLGGMVDWLSGSAAPAVELPDFPRPEGGVFWKAPKAGQDIRVDMPVIGPDTLRAARRAGLNGVAVQRGGVLVLDPETCASLAREGGIFLIAVDP
nr:LpxI family protein [Jannaschia sp. Os4]